MDTKKCSKCGEQKTLEEFYPRSERPGKFRSRCRVCCLSDPSVQAPARRARYARIVASNPAPLRAQNRNNQLKSRYGITTAEYDALLAEQDGVCAVCKNPPAGKRLSVDHNHATNQRRGLLCDACNTGLGLFRESTAIIESAVAYLEKFQQASA